MTDNFCKFGSSRVSSPMLLEPPATSAMRGWLEVNIHAFCAFPFAMKGKSWRTGFRDLMYTHTWKPMLRSVEPSQPLKCEKLENIRWLLRFCMIEWPLGLGFRAYISNHLGLSRGWYWKILNVLYKQDAASEIVAELSGQPDLVIGNYSDGNLVATLLSHHLGVTQVCRDQPHFNS